MYIPVRHVQKERTLFVLLDEFHRRVGQMLGHIDVAVEFLAD